MLQDIRQDILRRVDADGILQVWDEARSKWLSAERPVYGFGVNNRNASGRHMKTAGGVVSNQSGYRLPRNATITALTVQAEADVTGSFRIEVIRGGSPVTIHTETLTAQSGKTVTGLNLDTLSGDALAAVLMSGQFDFPVLTVEVAWR